MDGTPAARILVIVAVAGSGKTRRVVDEVIRLLHRGGVAAVAVLANSVRNEITRRVLDWAAENGHHRVDHNGRILEWSREDKGWVETAAAASSRGSHDYLRIDGLPGLVHVASLDGLVHLALSRIGELTPQGQIAIGARSTADGEAKEGEVVDADDYQGKKRLLRRLFLEDPCNIELAIDVIFPPIEGLEEERPIGLFLDEFQDVEDEIVDVAAGLALEVARRGGGNLTMVVGDPRQNVFGKAQRSILDFIERAEEGGEEGWLEVERMSVCHRCPQGHLALVNHLYPPPEHQRVDHPDEPGQGEEAGRRAREASRPVLIGVDTKDRRAAAEAMAKELVERFEEMVATDRAAEPVTAFRLFAKEAKEAKEEGVLVERWEAAPDGERARYMARAKAAGMRLDDVAVLSPQINNNPLLSCLEDELNRRLRAHAPPGQAAVKLFRTGEASTSINWGEAKGRVPMLTVHADKGMSHRLCLLCTAAEGILPDSKKAGSEIQYTSQLYVGLTRSTEALLVGVGVGNLEMGASTLFPSSTVNDRVISRYFRQRFARPREMLALCQWSRHSVCPVDDVVWFPNERYAQIASEDATKGQANRGITVTEWANRLRPEELVTDPLAPRTPLRFAPNLTHHPGMLSVRSASYELAIGRLAEQRLQAALRGHLRGDVFLAAAGSKRPGWVEAARVWRGRGEADVAGAIEWACRFGGEGGEALAPDLQLRGRQLWCLALVDLAGINDDPLSENRPAALAAAAELYAGHADHRTGIDTAALDLAVKMDVNASRTVAHLEEEFGADGLASALFEKDCRVIHPKPMTGRMDVYLPRADAVVEIKTTTVETGTNDPPDPRQRTDGDLPPPPGDGQPPPKRARREIPEEQPSKGAMSQALLYAGLMKGVTRSLVIDISRGAHWEYRFTAQERAQILERATTG